MDSPFQLQMVADDTSIPVAAEDLISEGGVWHWKVKCKLMKPACDTNHPMTADGTAYYIRC